ncbi:NUMOD4 domain-containing protein [Sphingomonas koreensis]
MNAPVEAWVVVDDFPDYAVSSLGRIKRIVTRWRSKAGRILKQNVIHGYCYVNLTRDGKVSACRVNRLVCAAYHGPAPTPAHHAAHNDGVRSNNTAQNVRWATASENMRDKDVHGTTPRGERNGAYTAPDRRPRGKLNGRHTKPERGPRGERHGSAKLDAAAVRAIRADSRSQRVVAAAHGVTKSTVASIKSGKTWGFVE